MKWWLVYIVLLYGLCTRDSTAAHELAYADDNVAGEDVETMYPASNDENNIFKASVDIKNLKSAMACQNSDLELECGMDEFVEPVSGYFGRFSLIACNPEYKNYPLNCVTKNVVGVIRRFCQSRGKCKIPATTVLFGDPCNGSPNVLEINYRCRKAFTTTEEIQTTETSTRRTHTSTRQASTEEPFNPEFIYVEHITDKKQDILFDVDLITIVATTTTTAEASSVKPATDSLSQLDSIIREKLTEDTPINVNSIKNVFNLVSKKTADMDASESSELKSQALILTAERFFDNADTWKALDKKERSKSATLLMDTVEKGMFDNNKHVSDIQINSARIAAELKLNKELKKELKFPTTQKLHTKESVHLKLKNPKRDQKFLFIVYNDIQELLTVDRKIKRSEAESIDDRLINTNIISFKMNKRDLKDLEELPVELTFTNLNKKNFTSAHQPVCAYWHYDETTYDGEWRTDGCSIRSSNQTHTVCSCTHLTHFAVLMDIHGVYEKLESKHTFILTLITIVCSVVSIICIVLTILVFRYLKIIRKPRDNSTTKDLTSITSHLCVCLAVSLVVFLAGIFIKTLELKAYCSFVAMLSHYFFLCSFLWMLLEGVQLYLMLIKIFNLSRSPVPKFCAIAYGVPLVIVCISILVNYISLDGQGYGTLAHCWLSSYKRFNLSFIIPISLILAANLVILVIVMHAMRNTVSSRKTYLSTNKKQEKLYRSLLISGCLIMTLLGLPWIYGYFIVDAEKSIVFSYIFTIINASQGTIIFFFHCIASKNVREELYRFVCQNKFRIVSGSTTRSNTSSKTLGINTKKQQNENNITKMTNTSSSRIRFKESPSKMLSQFLFCVKNKNTYNLQNDRNNMSSSSGDSSIIIKSPKTASGEVPLIEEDSHAKLIIYDPHHNDLNYHHNPLHYHPYHHQHLLQLDGNAPKRSSSHVSSNSSNSNRTQQTYISPSNQSYVLAAPAQATLPMYMRSSANSTKIKQASYTYYLIPRNNLNGTEQSSVVVPALKYVIPASSLIDTNDYANQDLPPMRPPAPPANSLSKNAPLLTTTPEDHNYSLIESEFQTDLQYYCDEPICSHAMAEDDRNMAGYTEAPNQYDELDDMKMLGSSSASSLSSISISKPIHNNNNNNKNSNVNQFTIPKSASVVFMHNS